VDEFEEFPPDFNRDVKGPWERDFFFELHGWGILIPGVARTCGSPRYLCLVRNCSLSCGVLFGL